MIARMNASSGDRIDLEWEADLPGFSTAAMHMERLTTISGLACGGD